VEVAGVLDAGGVEDCHRVFLDAPICRGGDGGRRRARGRHFRGGLGGVSLTACRRREQKEDAAVWGGRGAETADFCLPMEEGSDPAPANFCLTDGVGVGVADGVFYFHSKTFLIIIINFLKNN